jgi:hypothetical protein
MRNQTQLKTETKDIHYLCLDTVGQFVTPSGVQILHTTDKETKAQTLGCHSHGRQMQKNSKGNLLLLTTHLVPGMH